MTRANKKRTALAAFGLLVAATSTTLGTIGLEAFYNWYERFVWFDEVVHTASWFGFAILLAVLFDGRGLTRTGRHRLVFVFMVTLCTLGIGTLWEFAEWLWNIYGTPQRDSILGMYDTMTDLVLDTLGGFLASLVSVAVLAPLELAPESDHLELRRRSPARAPSPG